MDKLKRDLDPILRFFMRYSTNPNMPGDQLEKRLDDLDNNLKQLNSKIKGIGNLSGPTVGGVTFVHQPTPGTPSTSSSGLWGSVGSSGTRNHPNVSATMGNQVMIACIVTLETDLQKVKDKVEGSKVEVSGVTFSTRSDTKLWMQTNAGGPGMFVHFVDFHTLVNVGSSEFGSNLQVLKFDADSIKAGHTSEEEALVSASFKIEIPVIFGSDSSNTEGTRDSRVLPGCKLFSERDSGNGYTGLRYVLAKAVEDARSRLVESSHLNLTGMGLLVALEMIGASTQFVQALSTWILQEFNDLVGRGGDRDVTWKLICQSVKKIFYALHTLRQSGRGRLNPGDKSSSMMWGCLQAYKRMNEFVANNFSTDTDLFYILNKHLQDNTTTKKDTGALRVALEEANKDIARLEKRIDGLASIVGKK